MVSGNFNIHLYLKDNTLIFDFDIDTIALITIETIKISWKKHYTYYYTCV